MQQYTFEVTGETVEAVQLTPETKDKVAEWCGGRLVTEFDAIEHSKQYVGLNLRTLDGMVRVQEGGWVIRRPGGDFYTRTDNAFRTFFKDV